MIPRTRPAVAIPVGMPLATRAFLARTARTIARIPRISQIGIAGMTKAKITPIIPRTKDATAIFISLWLFFVFFVSKFD